MHELIVIIGEDVGEENLARLRTAHPDVTFRFCPSVEEFVAAAADADVLFSKRFPPPVWERAGRLRWVQAGTAGVNHLLDAGLRGSPVILTNAVGAHGVPMAEVILAMMLAFATRLHLLIHAQRTRTWIKDEVLAHKFELAGQTLCVIGLGDIGGTLAHKAKALGMHVLGVRRSATPFPGIDAQYTRDQLCDVLPAADHVALCLPLTDETQGVIGEEELRAMKPSATIYNVGRGASIDADALLRALHEGWIAGAGLDVTDPEPLPAASPLWTLPNVILSQHTSGSSPHNADRITAIFLDNLGRFRRGEPLRNVVDKTLGY
ncbi:MAG: D-2-hydroxyacid dehydrogenase [Caldilineaceae bacterium]|nr:D-2-hydroxyacid dehydrogenase [Caldilineaceae bacterium]